MRTARALKIEPRAVGPVDLGPAPEVRPLGERAGIAIVALTSATVLVTEIVATRMIAPYVGVTLETISAVIGCILAGISIGNWTGGRLADSRSPRARLSCALIAGGVLLSVAPVIVRVVGPRIAGEDPTAAVLLTMSAFFVPAVLLSTVSPVVLKGLGHDPSRLGRVAGNVSAFATIGALAGNFGAGFFLVGAFRSDTILATVGIGVVVLGCGLLVSMRNRNRLTMAACAGAAVTMLLGGAYVDGRLPCTSETKYVCLDIAHASGTSEYLIRSDVYNSSFTDTADPSALRLSYARDVAAAVRTSVPQPSRFLYVGGGGYTLPLHFADAYPRSTHTVLEIDTQLVEEVSNALRLRDHAQQISTTVGDARVSIAGLDDARFDVIVGDAFAGLSVPWHLTTVEFLADVRARLAAEGIYVMNVIDSGDYRFAKAEIRTLQAVFGDVVVLARPAVFFAEAGPRTNLVLVAGSDLPNADDLSAAARTLRSDSVSLTGGDVGAFVDDAIVLRDQFAPVDQLIGSP
ncbi:MAG: fused MFS/spermidine synthase [Actinomycetota bacterium]